MSLRLKDGTEQESAMSAVSEFQTAGAEQRKARSAKLVLVVGILLKHFVQWCTTVARCSSM